MFTAADARKVDTKTFDEMLASVVRDAPPGRSTYIPVYYEDYGANMDSRTKEVAAMLKERGFTNIEIRDLDSFRYAEVHFSWAEEE